MKPPRTAHWLVVSTLAFGMALAPVRVHAAPAKGDEPSTETGEVRSKAYKLPKSKPSAPPSDAPAAETKAPTGEAEGSPDAAAGTTPTPHAETPPDPSTPPGGEPTETPTAPETPLEPEITVQPRPVEPSVETSPAPTSIASREVVVDPRRVRSDDRILFRAGLLSFGVAGAGLVTTVVGLQQADHARRVIGRFDTPSEAGTRSDLLSYERTMNRMALVTGSLAVASVVTGALLMGLGARRGRPTPPAAVAPAVGPGTVGVTLRGRF